MSDTKEVRKDACEVCEEPLKPGQDRYGCEICARMFGPCCNSQDDNRCVECVE